MKALDAIDQWLSVLDGPPSVIVGNSLAIAKFRAVARRANQYVERPVEGLTGGAGAPIRREFYGNALLVDAGAKAGSNNPIIPVALGLTDLYAYRVGLDGFHGVTVSASRWSGPGCPTSPRRARSRPARSRWARSRSRSRRRRPPRSSAACRWRDGHPHDHRTRPGLHRHPGRGRLPRRRGVVDADNAAALAYFARHGYPVDTPAPARRGRGRRRRPSPRTTRRPRRPSPRSPSPTPSRRADPACRPCSIPTTSRR